MLEQPKLPKKPRSNSVEEFSAAIRPAPRGRNWSNQFAAAVRWLHIYVSLLAFTALVFFGVTGVTLNHPDWFISGDTQIVDDLQGELKLAWVQPEGHELAPADGSEPYVEKLEIVEHLRATHHLRGAVSEFRPDERECMILFKGPGYAADVIVQRDTGKYNVTVTKMGAVAIMNDLHKGRDTGPAWSMMIDAISIITVFVSVTGLILIFYLRRKRVSGIVTAVVGTIGLIAVAAWWIP